MAWRNLLPQGVEFIYAIALDPTNSSTIYGGTSYGVIMSTDGGRTWFTAFYLPAAFVQAVAVDPNTPNTAYAGTQGSGVFKTSDGGNSWNAMNDGIEFGFVRALAVAATNPSAVFVGMAERGKEKSTDGATWTIVDPTDAFDVDALCVDPRAPTTVYAGSSVDGVRKSMDGGRTWASVLNTKFVFTVAVDPLVSNTIYAGSGGLIEDHAVLKSEDHAVLKSTDGGVSWKETGLTNAIVNAIAIDPTTPSTLYAGTEPAKPLGTDGGVFRSVDAGQTWTDTGPGPTQVYSLAISATTPPRVYAGAVEGLFVMEPVPPCIGDCSSSNVVTVDDIITLVNIALGVAQTSRCPAGDINADNDITIDEIMVALTNALIGCLPATATPVVTPPPTQQPLPTPTATPFELQTCPRGLCSPPLTCVTSLTGSMGLCLHVVEGCAGFASDRCSSGLTCLELAGCCDLPGYCVPPAEYAAVCSSTVATGFNCPATPTPMPTNTAAPTVTPNCEWVYLRPGLTDCENDTDCVVVSSLWCCDCSKGGQQTAINRNKLDDLSTYLSTCCASTTDCFDDNLCRNDLGTRCQNGTCELVIQNTIPTPTATKSQPSPHATILPTPTPNGWFLCNGGEQDGQRCNSDSDCAPNGWCGYPNSVCDGGSDDGSACNCLSLQCVRFETSCSGPYSGYCPSSPTTGDCCTTTTTCAGGAPCVSTQKICLSGDAKGLPCLNDGQCPSATCGSTGRSCQGGIFDAFTCVDFIECGGPQGSSGVCIGK